MRRVLLVLSLLAVPNPLAAQQALAGARPNILFVFSDDHASQAIGAYGSRLNPTPNIDRLAQHGVLFRNNFCGNAICGPSRATILTGQHSHENGFMRNGNVFDGDQPTFPKLLQEAGYQTAIIGKWHLESAPQGFDHWMVLPGQGQYYNPDFLTRQGKQRFEGHVTDLTTQLALEWLTQRDPERPFLLMCQHKAPHRNWMPSPLDLGLYRDHDLPEPATLFDDYAGRAAPAKAQEMEVARHLFLHYDLLLPPDDDERTRLAGEDRAWPAIRERMTPAQRAAWDQAFAAEDAAFRQDRPEGKELVRWKYQRYLKNYLRCVAGVDRSVGALLDWLDAHPDVKANTLVIYSSDQGFYLGEHGWFDKRWMYEESLRMPLILSWPGHLTEGSEVTQLTQNIDFAPTLLELAGAPKLEGAHGTSLVPLLEHEKVQWRNAIYYHYYESQAVHMVPEMYGVRTERYKLVRYYEPQWNCTELFDLDNDPQELKSVADDPMYAEVRQVLERRLVELRAQYHDDTGQLGNGAFPITAGIARVLPDGDGRRVWANASGGYLLRTDAPAGATTLRTTVRPLPGKPQQNGFVLLSGAADVRHELLRAGIEFGARRLVIVGPGGMQVVAQAPIGGPGEADAELQVTIDWPAHRVVVEALGARIEAALPPAWTRLTTYGYGASNAEARFGPLQVR
ncbi:MAG: sulfatase [Planctomycetes bacterium]|nr:sulfatase [Planctomycetota bacterium]